MTQSHSAPAPAGSEHRVKPTALALHVASAASWGRPWRRRALSLPSPRSLTFQGIHLPLQPLRSWLHLLSRAGMLGVRPAAVSVLRQPEDDEGTPTRIEDLGFELATEMILDFANFARQSRLHSAAEQAEKTETETATSGDGEPPAIAASGVIDPLHALAMAGSVASESVDEDFLRLESPEPQESPSPGPAIPVQEIEQPSALEVPLPVAEPRVEPTVDVTDAPVMTEQHVPIAAEPVPDAQEYVGPPQSLSLETVAPVASPMPVIEEGTLESTVAPARTTFVEAVVAVVEPLQEAVIRNEMPEAPESEPEHEDSAETAAVAEEKVVDVPETVVREPLPQEPVEPPQLPVGSAAQEPAAAASVMDVEDETRPEQVPEPEHEAAVEAPKAKGPAIVVSDVRLARKAVVRPQSSVESEPAAQSPGVAEVVEVSAPVAEVAAEQPQAEVVEVAVQSETENPATVMHWEPMQAEAQVNEAIQGGRAADEFGFEPMITSLEDALAALAAANAIHAAPPTVPVEPAAEPDVAKAAPAPTAAEALQADDSTLEAVLRGIFIQKETEMTEMRDESNDADVRAATAPITSVELQEVAATLSVPQLEADPDDVLSDVQSTLNSLAGMAQGLTQQKQAAGRLQEELEEWNNQLQERERLAGDKEERLLQLESHLKEAKTNLDRMAAENNRLLAERSEALKELAQTVDLRDRTTIKRAESIQLEQQRIDEQTGNLRTRASELDERESALKRKSEELGVRLKQLQSAKDKFSAIVKSFNETVQFNSTLSAISKTVNE
ncbi:hypothetical protein FEA48_27680 [Pseudomonas nitroreducens]|uniref:Uncharacterized protein n=1 Tax=Pseudomonas nitroreducens TaxID=46680 RepID=A0A5R8ZX29_PSENT|nr:hypothetical protein [Pseudomonas nitroreducens]TLP70086.1 hypothetical protein FEA48_27680 [Pseudomonas nitroreducens]